MDMHDPAHPSEVLTGWLDDLGLSVTAFAKHLGVSRVMLSRILHYHAAISADMDLRLSEALGTSPGFWLRSRCSAIYGKHGSKLSNANRWQGWPPDRVSRL